MDLTITNRSGWPTAAMNVICKWLVKREGVVAVDWPYEITLRNTKFKHNYWSGRGGKFACSVRFHRRASHINWDAPKGERRDYWGNYTITEKRFRSDFEFPVRSRLEVLVFLLAHEICHGNRGNRNAYKTNGRIDRCDMESTCNRIGAQAVEALREEWPRLASEIATAMRAERRKKQQKRSPDLRLQKRIQQAESQLKTWRRKHKLAETKLAKYRTMHMRLLKQQAGRAGLDLAAKSSRTKK